MGGGTRPITLDQLIALNDEIAALTRAGVPLEQGLRALGEDLPGRLGKTARGLGARLEGGESLLQAFQQLGDLFPPVYRAVVLAGLRSGRISAALEGIAFTSRRVAQLRSVMIISMVYPFIVLQVATAVLLFTNNKTQPVVYQTYGELGVSTPAWYETAMWFSQRMDVVLVIVWVVVLLLFVLWLIRSGRAASSLTGGLRGIPTIGRLLTAGRMATFAELLSLLVEQDVPLTESITLAAAASGDARLERATATLVERIEAGESMAPIPAGFPPLLGWLLVSGSGQQTLIKALRQSAATYRRRVEYQGTWLGVYLPIFVSAGIGGAVVLYYVVLVLAPFYSLLYQLAVPLSM